MSAPEVPEDAPPWYGGNKIPASYLKRFTEPHAGPHSKNGLPYDLERFLGEMGGE